MSLLLIQYVYSLNDIIKKDIIKKIWKWEKSNKKIKAICFILSLSMVLLVFPKPVFAVEVNPFIEKWGKDLSIYPGVQSDYCTNVMPVTADVVGDSWHEIFLSLGFDHSFSDDGIVFCLDGHTGEVLWSYFSENFGSHTCLELYDLDSDGDLELLATGYHHVVAFHAENGSILWEFTRPNNRQDKPAVILEEDGVVYVFTCSHQGADGIGLQKRLGATGTLVAEVAGPLHPCHGGLSAEDLDGDGEFELIITDRDFGTGSRGVHCYDTDLNLLWSQPTVQCSSHLANIVDVNNDGVFDVVAMDQGDGSAGICVVDGSTGQPMSGKWDRNLGLYAHYTPAIYDIDQDGHLELITTNGGGPASVWDLETWSLDAELWRRDGYGLCKPPQIANVLGDSDMEMVFVTHAGFEMFDKNYDLVAYHDDGYDGRADRMLIQDIDGDGFNEIVAIMHEPGSGSNTYAFIQCLDTSGAAPDPSARTDNFLYSLRRNGVSVYVPPPGGQGTSNSPPVSNDGFYSTDENTALNVAAPGVLDNDIDNDGPLALTAILDDDVDHGSLTLNLNGSFEYIPDVDWSGVDTFTYHAFDGEDNSNVAMVSISVFEVNDPPVAVNDAITIEEDTSVVINVLDNDYDVDGIIYPTTVIIVTDAMHGNANIDPNTGEVTYIPDPDYFGTDSFTYTVDDDDSATSNVAVVDITVTEINDPPVAVDDVVNVEEDIAFAIDVLDNDYDVDGVVDPTSVVIVIDVTHGNTDVDPDTGEVTYIPDFDYFGSDGFSYTVVDDDGAASNVAVVDIAVTEINDPPVAVNDAVTIEEDISVVIDVLDNDYDVDGIIYPTTVVIVTDAMHGNANIDPNTGEVTYIPDPDYFGSDGFSYTVDDDDSATSNVAVVDITVTEINDIPDAPIVDGSTSGIAGVVYTYTTTTIDPDGDLLYYMFDWGDGIFSDWLGPNWSGEEITASHIWNGGSYTIKVKAKDIHEAESDWSDPLLVYMSFNEFPDNESTDAERPPPELSVTIEDPDGEALDVYICWKNHYWEWITLEAYIGIGNGTCNYALSAVNDWIWGNTTYTWSVNVTDGTLWRNETYEYTTSGSRYDVNNDDNVNFQDAGLVWIHRTTEVPYDGIYDVNDDGQVNFQDAGLMWIKIKDQ